MIRKALLVVADIAVTFASYVFVFELTNEDAAAGAASVIVGAFVVKGWIERFSAESSDNSDDEQAVGQTTKMLLIVGAIGISAIAFEAMEEASGAEYSAHEAEEEVEDLQSRVYELEEYHDY